MMAAVADVGRPIASNGANAAAAEALLAASGPATPSMAPLPNSSGCFDSFFSLTYDSTVGTSLPPTGSVPNAKPMPVPRSHGFQERAQSLRLIQSEPFTAYRFSVT